MGRGSKDLIIVIALAVAGLVAALLPGVTGLVRAPLTLVLALALPGYALVAALNPRRAGGGVEQAVLALGASMALTILGGLLLNLTPWGLRRESWAILLAALTVGAAAAAMARRRALGPAAAADAADTGAPTRPAPRPQLVQVALLGVAALLLLSAVGVARLSAVAQPASGFTQLWMQPLDSGDPNAVRLGVSNQEAAPMRYLLRVTAGERVLREWPEIALEPGESWEITESLTVEPGEGQPVEAALYRSGETGSVYRRAVLWLGASAGGQ